VDHCGFLLQNKHILFLGENPCHKRWAGSS
jgi:hypothetical protein